MRVVASSIGLLYVKQIYLKFRRLPGDIFARKGEPDSEALFEINFANGEFILGLSEYISYDVLYSPQIVAIHQYKFLTA